MGYARKARRASVTFEIPRVGCQWGATPVRSMMEDMRRTIRLAGATASCPDGLPFSCWKGLANLAVTALHDTYGRTPVPSTGRPTSRFGPCDLNGSLLVLLPKVPSGWDPTLGACRCPSDTRPSMLVDTSSWLFAGALRLRVQRKGWACLPACVLQCAHNLGECGLAEGRHEEGGSVEKGPCGLLVRAQSRFPLLGAWLAPPSVGAALGPRACPLVYPGSASQPGFGITSAFGPGSAKYPRIIHQ